MGIGIGGELKQEITKRSGVAIREAAGECEGRYAFALQGISLMACCNNSSGR